MEKWRELAAQIEEHGRRYDAATNDGEREIQLKLGRQKFQLAKRLRKAKYAQPT